MIRDLLWKVSAMNVDDTGKSLGKTRGEVTAWTPRLNSGQASLAGARCPSNRQAGSSREISPIIDIIVLNVQSVHCVMSHTPLLFAVPKADSFIPLSRSPTALLSAFTNVFLSSERFLHLT